jgi:hypothetical protein
MHILDGNLRLALPPQTTDFVGGDKLHRYTVFFDKYLLSNGLKGLYGLGKKSPAARLGTAPLLYMRE